MPVFLIFIGIGYCKFCLPERSDAATQGVQASANGRLTPEIEKRAADAGLAYWQEHYGGEGASAKVSDFGCHLQVDIIREGKTVKSLQYQNGNITER